MEKRIKLARWVLAAACVMLLFLLAMVCLDIYLDEAGFSRETIAQRLQIVAPMLVLSFIAAAVSAVFVLKNGEKRENDASAGLYKPPKEGGKKGRLRVLILCAALVFIVLGAMNGGARDVLIKAINICTECIGLG